MSDTIDKHVSATLAASSRQYVKNLAEKQVESGLIILESQLGGKEISTERMLVTLGGIMALRSLLRKLDADIRAMQETPMPSPNGTA